MDKEKRFTRLKADDPLVLELAPRKDQELASGKYPWWNNLVALSHTDKDINIQVRGSYLSVYYKMGCMLDIRMQGKMVVCKVHYKYLIGAQLPEYLDVHRSKNHIEVRQKSSDFVSAILTKKNFDLVKENISTRAGEEKQIQSRLMEKNRATLLDAEVAFNDSEQQADSEDRKTRIDLVNYDKKRKSIVFVELKQIFDKRLYSNEINKQIAKYVAFAQKRPENLIEAYKDVILVKRVLKLISEKSYLASVDIKEVEPRPILAIAGYDQDVIEAKKGKIRAGLKTSNLSGLYFFGKDVDLNLKSNKNDKNKEIFI
jgi:Holliday junction resolvase-like predicted endonuclease